MALSTIIYRDGVRLRESPSFDRISDLLEDASLVIWVDALNPTADELEGLQEEFSLPAHAVEDAIEAHQRPKLDHYDGHVFGVAYGVSLDGDLLGLHEVGMFISERYLVTVRRDENHPSWRQLEERLAARPDLMRIGGGFLTYVVLDEIVDEYFRTVTDLQDQLAVLESQLLGDEQDDAVLGGVYTLRRNLISFRRVVQPLRDVLAGVQRVDHYTVTDRRLADHYRDLYDHVVRVYEELDIAREVLNAAQEGYLSMVSNRLNNVVLRVSSWAAIIAVPTFIASVYGMNFVHMPELGARYGYPICMAAMLVIAALLYRLFKRAGWL